ncbi:methylated-DNA--[protein]-cysteine S-methyltransferase [Sanguibacter antarcticus]|uniref:Methylated-DNA--protein-cysteine methyltransferase n=1 Tax=Sanguibacter antarcticus TaxID=372484 RepID=A0A2A9E323_9MICO|nr:methylated-DNA--[protein]-cysteine S-methyltransferase [Sanguibacter antarcticus]PFG32600.1 methylated-DNA-[protein]-cysteine S-methyltransferase [Sanguibacter antarcticus]
MKTFTVISSPLGDLTAVATDGTLSALYMTDAVHRPSDASFGEATEAGFALLREEITRYFAGELRTFTVETAAAGTPFQLRVWAALARIPYGQTRSYAEIAHDLGDPRTVRAVGAANGRNPLSIVVPCHRVVGADGSLVGFAGGIERKRALLDLENPAHGRSGVLF